MGWAVEELVLSPESRKALEESFDKRHDDFVKEVKRATVEFWMMASSKAPTPPPTLPDKPNQHG
jgi:hypothetical protein